MQGYQIVLIDQVEAARELCRDLLKYTDLDNHGVFDYETVNPETGLPTSSSYRPEILLTSVCFRPEIAFVVYGDLWVELADWLRSPYHGKMAHNFEFDRECAETNVVEPIEVKGPYRDTMYEVWLEDTERGKGEVWDHSKMRPEEYLGLKPQVLYRFGYAMHDFESVFKYVPSGKKARVFARMIDVLENKSHPAYNRDLAIHYSGDDARWNYMLGTNLRSSLESIGYWDHYINRERYYLEVLHNMEKRGIRLDIPHFKETEQAIGVALMRNDRVWNRHIASRLDVEVIGRPLNHPFEVGKGSTDKLAHLFFRHGEDIYLSQIESNKVKSRDLRFTYDCGCPRPHKYHPRQVGEPKPKRGWPDGTPSMDSQKVIPRLVSEGCKAAKILQGSKVLSTLDRTFVKRFIKSGEREEFEGRVLAVAHTRWYAMLRTGRISGRENSRELCGTLQNVPSQSEKDPFRLRRGFVARPGYALIVRDYSQLELRLAAHWGNCKAMLAAFASGHDIHSWTAVQMFNLDCTPDECKKKYPDQRSAAKAINFGIIYGLTAASLADRLGVEKKVAEDFIKLWLSTYPGVAQYIKDSVKWAKAKGYAETIGGHRRYIPGLRHAPPRKNWKRMTESERQHTMEYRHLENVATNAPIQGSAGDVMREAMLYIAEDQELIDADVHMLLQIHDEIVCEAPIEYAQWADKRIDYWMQKPYEDILRVALKTGGGIAFDWEEAK